MKIKGLSKLNASLKEAASGGFSRQAAKWLEQSGQDFLDMVQDELISSQSIDTERLFSSFQKGDADHIWIAESGGLSLEVGSNLEYASFVNDGRWTTEGDGVKWVPGYFQGARFVYDPASSTGMALKKNGSAAQAIGTMRLFYLNRYLRSHWSKNCVNGLRHCKEEWDEQ